MARLFSFTAYDIITGIAVIALAVAIAEKRGWSVRRTMAFTFFAGLAADILGRHLGLSA